MRRFFRIFSLSLTLLLAILLAVFLWLQHQLRQLPVSALDYQISNWGLRQLHLEYLHFDYLLDDHPLQVELHQLVLRWRWQSWRPRLEAITLQQAALTLSQLPASSEPGEAAQLQLPEHWHWPDWLPHHNRIDQLLLDLPCGEQRCRYQGTLQLDSNEQLDARLLLTPQSQPEQQLSLQLNYQLAQFWPDIKLKLHITDLLQLTATSSLSAADSNALQPNWQGETELSLQPPPDWLLAELAHWQIELPELWLQQFQQTVTANGQWHFKVPADIGAQLWQQLDGHMQVQLSSPSPLYLPGVGLLTAELQASAEFNQGQLAPFRLAAGGTLAELQLPTALTELGFQAEPLYWSLSSQHSQALSLAALPLQLRLGSASQQQQLLAEFKLDLPSQQAAINKLDMSLTQPQLRSGDWLLNKLQLTASLTGSLSANRLQLTSTKPLRLETALQNPALELNVTTAAIALDNLQFEASLAGAPNSSQRLAAQLAFDAKQLQHPALKTLDWQWQGNLSASSSDHWQLSSDGQLAASSGLELRTDLQANPSKLSLHWQLADVFILAGNTLATTLADWPELLTLQRGRIKHQGELKLALADHSYRLSSSTELLDLTGFYDTTIFRGLNSQLMLSADPQQLHLSTARLTLEQFEQGVVAGPLHLAADYQADWGAPAAGKLQLHDNQLILFNGRVSLPPTTLDLSQQQWLLPLQISQLDLQQLLTQHPTSDLTGQGLINGEIPLIISAKGIEVAQGRLRAEEPGGKLSYRSPQAAGMAASNPGMKMIVAALDDFHYSVLSSDVSYSTDGHLTLALRLEGRNPGLEGGRPVHFNITLEENIPALITSLQLTNQLNDVIQQRVQERLQPARRP